MQTETKIDDGGFAFPQDRPLYSIEGVGCPQLVKDGNASTGGLTVRDYFAAQALAGLLANSQITKEAVKLQISPKDNQSWHANSAYQFADAMIAARKEGGANE